MTSQIRVDEITNRSGLGTVTIYDNGFEFTGVTTFTEDVDITGGLTIGGVLTYEDVTNIDSVGVVTARNGLNVTGGNIGIGENNPQNSIHISGSAPAIRFVDSGANGSAFSIIEDNNGLLKIRNDAGNSGTGSGIAFEVDAAERLRVDNAGRIGINETAPDRTLHVNSGSTDTALKLESTDAEVSLELSDNTGSSYIGGGGNYLNFYSGGNERLRITSDGRIGINETSPSHVLDVKSQAAGTYFINGQNHNGNNIFQVYESSDGDGNHGMIYLNNGSGTTLTKISTNGSSYFNGGNIGIGIANPTNRLHVYSSSDTGEIRLGGGNGSGNHRLFFQAHPSNAYIDSYGNNTHNPLSINADPLILNNSGSGKVLIHTTTNNDNQAWLVVNGTTDSGNIITGRIADSTNNNNRTVLLFRMNQGQGFQFSGDIIVNSWTGNAKVNCHITVQYQNQNVEVDVVNATHSSQISKSSLRVVTADYGSNRYLGIQKNGGGTGVFYINAMVSSNIDTAGNGGIREVNNSSLGSVTNHGNLN
tara:strand:- start:1276 stop:2871 length:1596 start_codon:yes stop_codon:yes gene_type:complete